MTHATEVLADRYELHEELGRGGMGVVYAAMDRSLQRRVAVKVLPADRAADPLLVARFEREALAAAALSHRNIVAVFDTGRHEDTHYIVMEFLRGQSLSQLLRSRGVLPVDEAVSVATQIASALAAAHAAGIVHRDIKPANVMVAPDGAVKVLDFGIARMASSTTLTHASMVLGSAPYMAPEVAQGLPADARSDIYSLGCVLYELLTGRAPFTGELAAAVLHQHSTAPPQSVTALNPAVPPGLDALVMRMLAKQPEARPQHAEELIERLGDPLGSHAATTQPLPAHAGRLAASAATGPPSSVAATRRMPPTAATRPMPATAGTRPLPPSGVARWPRMLAAGALALALAAILAIVLASGGGQGKPIAGTTHHASARRSAGTATDKASGSAAGSTTTPTSTTASTPSTATGSSSSTSSTGESTTATTGTASAPVTPASAASSLSTLLTQDLQAGTIDPQAGQQISQQLQGLLNQYQQGQANDALKQLSKLQQQLFVLTQHGDINPSATPGIAAAVSTLSVALNGAATLTGGDNSDQSGPGPAGPKPHGGPKQDH